MKTRIKLERESGETWKPVVRSKNSQRRRRAGITFFDTRWMSLERLAKTHFAEAKLSGEFFRNFFFFHRMWSIVCPGFDSRLHLLSRGKNPIEEKAKGSEIIFCASSLCRFFPPPTLCLRSGSLSATKTKQKKSWRKFSMEDFRENRFCFCAASLPCRCLRLVLHHHDM